MSKSESKVSTKSMAKDYAAMFGQPSPPKRKRAKRSKRERAQLRKTIANPSHPKRYDALDELRDTRGVTPKSVARFLSK